MPRLKPFLFLFFKVLERIYSKQKTLPFGVGLGTLLLLAAVFAGVLARLPKPGPWLRDVKRHGGFMVLVMACTLVASRLDGARLAACFWSVAIGWVLFAALTWRYAVVPWDEAPFEMLMRKNELRPFALLKRLPALVLWRDMPLSSSSSSSSATVGAAENDAPAAGDDDYVEKSTKTISCCGANGASSVQNGGWRRRTACTLALVVCVVVGTYLAWSWSASGEVNTWPPSALIHGPRTDLTWYHEWEPAVAAANASGSAMMVVFKADWCAPCRAMEYGPLASPAVARAAIGVGGGASSSSSASSSTGGGGGGGGRGGGAVPLGAPPIVAVQLDCTKGTMPGARLKREVWGIAATPATAFATAADVAAAASPSEIRPSTVLDHYQGEEALVSAIGAARGGRSLGAVGNGRVTHSLDFIL